MADSTIYSPTPQNPAQQNLQKLDPYSYTLRYGYGAPNGPPMPTTPITSPGGAEQPQQPSQLATTLQQQLAAANQYKSNLQNYSDSLYNPYAASVNRSLNYSVMPSIKSSYNSRGLLNSGMEAGAEAGARASASQDLAGTRRQINEGLLGNLNTMQTAPFQTAGVMAQPGGNTANFQLNNLASYLAGQYGNQNLMNQMYGNISAGAGSVLGTMAGSGNKYSPTGGTKSQPQNIFSGGDPSAGAGSYMGYGYGGYGINPYGYNGGP